MEVRPPLASIVIPVYNRLDLTRRCLEAAVAGAAGVAFETIIVDDGSTDGTAEWAAAQEGVRLIRMGRNEGFARACNRGASEARGEFIVFLNNDLVTGPGWLSALIQAAREAGAAAVGGKLLFPDGTIQHAGVTFNAAGIPEHFLRKMPYASAPFVNLRREFQAVTAACLLTPRDWFVRLGGLDEAYRSGYEDVDYCLRAGEAGGRVIYEPACAGVHLESQSEGRHRHEDANRALFMGRWSARVRPDADDLAREFLTGWIGRPAVFAAVVRFREPGPELFRTLASLKAAADSPERFVFAVADQFFPEQSRDLEPLEAGFGRPLKRLWLPPAASFMDVLAAGATLEADYIAVFEAGVVVGPGWAHRLASHLRGERLAIAAPMLVGAVGAQDARRVLDGGDGAYVRILEASNAVFIRHGGCEDAASALLPLAAMALRQTAASLPRGLPEHGWETILRGAGMELVIARDTLMAVEKNPSAPPPVLPEFSELAKKLDASKPWLLLGKGPTFERVGGLDLGKWNICSLNHVAREMPVTLAHCIDIKPVLDMGESLARNARFVVMPFRPHTGNRPSQKTLPEFAAEVPVLARLAAEGRLYWYNLDSSPPEGSGRVIAARFFSSEAAVDLLAALGAKTIRSLGIDGGTEYAPRFADLSSSTRLDNGHDCYDRQFSGIARTIQRTGVLYGPLHTDIPVRIFVGSDRNQRLATKVLEYSIRRHASLSVEVVAIDDRDVPVPKDPQNRSKTGFSFSRFHIPKLCGYTGRGIYVDADMLVFSDIAELWKQSFEGAQMLHAGLPPGSERKPQFSVMLLDCARLDWDVSEIVAGLDAGRYGYRELMQEMCLLAPEQRKASLLPEWNSLERYDVGRTRLIHYTDMPTQPWISPVNPNGGLWYAALKEAVETGFIGADLVYEEAAAGRVHPDLPHWIGLPDSPAWPELRRNWAPPFRMIGRPSSVPVLR
jgi:GT2 family glycosyltransferase